MTSPAADLRPGVDFAAVQSCFNNPIFDTEATARLLCAIDRPIHGNGLPLHRIEEELFEITKHFAFERFHELQPSSSKQAAQVAKLEAALRQVLETLGFPGGPSRADLLPMFANGGLFAAAAVRGEPDGEAATMNQLGCVWTMLLDAQKLGAVHRLRREIAGPRTGRPPERAIKHLAARLSELYWLTWLESPTIAFNDEGEAASPFLRLFVGVRAALRERGVDPGLRTPEALAKVWERLDPSEKLKFKSTWPVS